MIPHLSQSDILFLMAIMAMIFAIFRYFRDPQVKTEKKAVATSFELEALKADITNLKDNHIHTITVGLIETNKAVTSLTVEVAKLSTIIDERIPKKAL